MLIGWVGSVVGDATAVAYSGIAHWCGFLLRSKRESNNNIRANCCAYQTFKDAVYEVLRRKVFCFVGSRLSLRFLNDLENRCRLKLKLTASLYVGICTSMR